ncbi:SNARE domain containing protein [Plasmodium cynomolgi strain B]|nr:SNARE domain containing protein [Plasmodium cynomolgi strain B]GAB66049.1 SNARE domain containing protein [Plasmodium cynomolgi strain B]
MENVNRKLTGVYRRVKNIIKTKGNKYMFYLILFFLFLLFFMNYLYRKNR